MSNFMGVGIFWIGLNRADLGCWRLTFKSLIMTQNCDKYIGLVKSTFLVLQELFVQFQRYQTPSAILLYRYLTNVYRGRIKYELIYSLRGARHLVDYSVHIR